MAHSLSDLQALLKSLDGVNEAYIQAPTSGLNYPCIMIAPDKPRVQFADNKKYLLKKGYSLIIMDRDPFTAIPDLVEALPHSSFDRYYRTNGIHHFAFQIFY